MQSRAAVTIDGTYQRLAENGSYIVRSRVNGRDPRAVAFACLDMAAQATTAGRQFRKAYEGRSVAESFATARTWLRLARAYNWAWEHGGQRLP